LPLREFYSLFTGQRPPDQWQDRATGRQQFTNALLAREAGKIAQAHSGNPTRTVIARSPRISAPMPGNEQWAVHTPAWPTRIPLTGLLNGAPSTWRNLALGVTVHEDGRSEVIRVDMARLVHIAVGGSSGWGKSVFLQSLAYQLAQSKDAIDLTLIDLEGVTFAPFAECERLLYPTADTENGALAILSALTEEMNRRKSLYADCPGVANLEQYNARASEPISPVVAIFDEATALLDNSGVESAIKTLVLRARKYGLWLVLGGQDWKASSLSTTIRNQLSTRIQFRALSKSQSRVLLQRSGAEALDVPGRALAIIPGRDVVKFQAPIISYETIQATVSGDGPRLAMPETLGQIESSKQSDQILNLKADGASDTRIAREVFGYGNSFYIEKVRGVLRQQQQPATV